MDATWGIVELMGHNVIAGRISEESIAGTPMLRVDVPAMDAEPAYTKLYGGQAVYGITPTDEATAVAAARKLAIQPVSPYIFPRQLPGPSEMPWAEVEEAGHLSELEYGQEEGEPETDPGDRPEEA